MATLYADRLVREGVLTSEECDQLRQQTAGRLAAAFDAAQQSAERYELQELSAVSTEEIASFCPRTSVSGSATL